jgi:hypothetical protein
MLRLSHKNFKIGKDEESEEKRETDSADKKEFPSETDPLIGSIIKTTETTSTVATTTTAMTTTTKAAVTSTTGGATNIVVLGEAGDEYADSLLEITR